MSHACRGGVIDAPAVPTPECMVRQVASGVIPNQHGTWPYGRAGWCPGGAVRPWLVDVTADLLPTGGTQNAISYKGLYQGAAPVIAANASAGYIMMSSQLVFYS